MEVKLHRALTLLVTALACAASSAAVPAQGTRRIFEDYGGPSAGKIEPGGALWLSLWEPHIRFTLPAQPAAKIQQLSHLLKRTDGGPSLKLRYDAAGGRINAATGTIDYPLCGIVIEDLTFEPEARCDTAAAAAPSTPEESLVRGRAHASAGDVEVAQALLEPLSFSEPSHHKLLLRIRSETGLALAQLEDHLSPSSDRALAASLTDLRALEKLDPDDAETQFSIGLTLEHLGGYAEAAAVYGNILARWPDDELRVAVRLGALFRQQGNFQEALSQLNALASRTPQEGMRYHYHRGWTLSLLGRMDEAIAEYSEGLRTQPDYSSAYLRRACARASLGQLDEALRDVDEASRLVSALPGAGASPIGREEIAHVQDTRRRIRAGLPGGKAVPDACDAPYWLRYQTPRMRSPLLSPT